jgi:hypothetical protein
MIPDWLKFKRYPHIGYPLTKRNDLGWIISYVKNPKKIESHRFTPLLHKKIYQRKFRPSVDALKKDGKRIRTVQEPKQRPIFYASHLDSIIYSYYSDLLTKAYESYLIDKEFGMCAVAYRKIPIVKSKKGNKCNIEFAYDTFKFIEDNKENNLSVIVADITSFFDNLNHRILHSQWKRVLKVDDLPNDHYNIYKSLIYKRYVNELELFNRFKDNLIVERGIPDEPNKIQLKNASVKKIWNLKRERVVSYCSKSDFFSKATDLIRIEKPCSHQHKKCRQNCNLKGIPQGTPMSATLANIYMLDFDEKIYDIVVDKNAYYQRYSDDLVIVCKQEDETFFYNLIRESIEKLANLDIQPKKTNIYRYSNNLGVFSGGILKDGVIESNKQLEYLGFVYDGNKIRVKTVGFSKFYRSMKRAFRRGVHFASKPTNKSHNLFEERLYKRFSYKGAKRRLIYKPNPSSETGFVKSKEQHWGNYLSYLEKANNIMKPINGDDNIKRQYSKFWKNFGKEMKKAYSEIGKKVLRK